MAPSRIDGQQAAAPSGSRETFAPDWSDADFAADNVHERTNSRVSRWLFSCDMFGYLTSLGNPETGNFTLWSDGLW